MNSIKGIAKLFLIVSVFGTILFTFIGLSDTKTTQYPDPTELFFVDDYSHVWNADTEYWIFDQAVRLYEVSKAQICLVSVPDTQADSLETYSLKLANSWGIGDEEEDNGILILFTTDEPHVRLEVGKGLEGCIPDGKAGRILDEYAVKPKDKGEWNKAALNTFIAVAKTIYEEYGIKAPADLEFFEETDESGGLSSEADGEVPQMIVEENEDPVYLVILYAFVCFWMIFLIPFIIFLIVWKFKWYNDYEDLCDLSAWSSGLSPGGRGGGGSSYRGGGSSYRGGGGSFGGGGASR